MKLLVKSKMYTKSPRFRNSGSNSSDTVSKTSANIQRDSRGSDLRAIDDDAQSGSYSVKKINSVDSEKSQTLKRPISSDRQHPGPPDKKKIGQREVKRTTSFIPRATSQRSKTPSGCEVKKSARKSDTSLKIKEPFDSTGKDKKYEPLKNIKRPNILDAKTNVENEVKRIGESPRRSAKGSDPPTRDLSITRVHGRNVHSRGGQSTDGRRAEKVESKVSNRGSSAAPDESQPKSLESQYIAKKTVYGLMVKEFHEKQKSIREQYKLLQELKKKILANSGKELQPEELVKIVDVEPPFVIAAEVLKKKFEPPEKRIIITFESKIFNDIRVDFTEFQNTLEAALNQSRDIWLHLVPAFLNSRRELIKKIAEKNVNLDAAELEKDEKSLELAVENAKCYSKVKIDDLTVELKKLYANRETLKHELKTLLDGEKLSNLLAKDYKDMASRLKEVEEELAKEKIRTEDLMEKRNLLEETRLAEAEKIENLQQTIVGQQNQLMQLTYQCKALKQKELMSNMIKPKDIKDLKAKSELLKMLENHVTELTNEYNAEKKIFQTRIGELEQSLEEKEQALKTESQTRQTLESSLAEAEEKIRSVREKKNIFTEMVDKTKQILQTTNSGSTKREEQLWTELEATKIVVKGYQDQLNKLAEEKNKLFLKFQTISEDKSNPNAERLAADLVRKEEIIKNLNEQVSQLQTSCDEQSAKYNKLLAQIKEVHEKTDGKTDAATLSKQLGDIKMQKKELQELVKELVNHNEELETALVQRSLELDQRDRLVKQQCNLLKMRDELTNLVRSKDDTQFQGVKKAMEQSTKWEKKAEKIYKDLERKANELDDMYKILIEKQKQVEKLMKLVKIMEDQQNRAQEQRVRFESKIAELQRQLSEGKQKQAKTPLFGN